MPDPTLIRPNAPETVTEALTRAVLVLDDDRRGCTLADAKGWLSASLAFDPEY